MTPKPKLEVLQPLPRECDSAALDAFHEERVRRDLVRFASEPGLFGQCAERIRVRFQKSGEKAIAEHWTSFFQAGERLIAAKAAMERRKSEYLQLAREHEIKEAEKTASLTSNFRRISKSKTSAGTRRPTSGNTSKDLLRAERTPSRTRTNGSSMRPLTIAYGTPAGKCTNRSGPCIF